MNQAVPVAVEFDVPLRLFASALTDAGFDVRYSGDGLKVSRASVPRTQAAPPVPTEKPRRRARPKKKASRSSH